MEEALWPLDVQKAYGLDIATTLDVSDAPI